MIQGDARLSMESEFERQELQQFDVLVIDAFSGDSIPVHLLTVEAFEIYLKHLRKPDGILALHVTNRHLDLKPIIHRAADELHLRSVWIHSGETDRTTMDSDWILLSREGRLMDSPAILNAKTAWDPRLPSARMWTDDYSNLLRVLKTK